MNESLALLEVLDHPQRALERDLGHDPIHGLNEVEVGVINADGRELLQHRRHHAAQFRESLNSGKTSTDHNNGQKPISCWARGHICRDVEIVNHTVSHGDCFLDGLHPDRNIGNSGNGERSRHRSRGNDDVVVIQAERLLTFRGHGHGLVLVVNTGHSGRNHAALVEVTSQRNNRVASLNRASRNLREEGLVGHVRKRIDDDHFGFTSTEKLLKLESGVETGVTAADNHNSSHKAPRWGE